MGTQISIDKVWPPKKTNGKYGTVKLTTGERWFIPVEKLNIIRSGMMAVVETRQANWSDGVVTIIDSVVENPGNGNTPVANYDPGGKDRQIFIQGVAQAALHGMSWTNEMTAREAVFNACEAAQDAYDTFILGKGAPAPEPPRAAPQSDFRASGRPYGGGYSTSPQDDPRFAAPVAGPDDYGAQR